MFPRQPTSVYVILNVLEKEQRSNFAKVWVLGWGRWHVILEQKEEGKKVDIVKLYEVQMERDMLTWTKMLQ